jgi:hypothetical protein
MSLIGTPKIWLSPDRSHILNLPYGLIGDTVGTWCNWCPYYCACCQNLIPNFCGDGSDPWDGKGGGVGGVDLSYVVTCSDPTKSTTGYLVNDDNGRGNTGPCNWENPFATFETDLYAFDSVRQDPENGCKWVMVARFFGDDCFDTAIVSDDSSCSGTFTFTFNCGGLDWVVVFTIPMMMAMRAAAPAPKTESPKDVVKRINSRPKPCNCGKRGK